jgi:3-phenylpropionate/cinnamic acid dioxygenase small subunit
MSGVAPTTGIGTLVPEAVRREVEDFLYQEADLLDDWHLGEWLALFTDDCRYWAPCTSDGDRVTPPSMLLDDTHLTLEDRVMRLLHPAVHSQAHRSRTRRVIGNVRVQPAEDGAVRAVCNFILYENRRNDERVFAGRSEYVLVRDADGAWRIRQKRIELANGDRPLGILSILL